MSAPSLAGRVEALGRFVRAADGYLPPADLAPAQALAGRVGERLSLSGNHTVVALAGSTGSGKSSIFNTLAGLELSPVGVRRPTTGRTHACVWGTEGAGALLDWLGVDRRYSKENGGALDGLVLLDLPDFDSVDDSHRVEADRLLAVVDLIVWVLHPQKYADKVVHRGYIGRFHRYRDITVVVLNQADTLSKEDLRACVDDLHRLLREEGLDGVPTLTASTVGPPGLQDLSDVLAKAVAARQAALRRLEADVSEVSAGLRHHVGDAAAPLDRAAKTKLVDALSRAAGAPVVASATEKAYVHRARKATGWPPLRWLRRVRPDPLSRLHLGAYVASATSIGPASPAATAGVSLALRDTAAAAAQALPEPWEASLLEAVRTHADDLPDALDQAIARTDLGVSRSRWWWHAIGALQWLTVAAAAAGLLWLALRYALFALALPEPPMPHAGRLPLPTLLLAGGLIAGLVISFFARVLVRVAARRTRRRAERRMRAGIEKVAADRVLTPADRVVAAYTQARQALRDTGK
jgi:hypothetical protein